MRSARVLTQTEIANRPRAEQEVEQSSKEGMTKLAQAGIMEKRNASRKESYHERANSDR